MGRSREQAVLGRLVHDARAGRSGVLVLRGPAGIGKTALLDGVLAQAAGFRIVRMHAVESEAAYPRAGLQMLWEMLPERPTGAGIEAMREPGRHTRRLIAEAAARQPLICVVDDAQWLDQASAQALAYALRRLEGHRVAVLLAERDDAPSVLADLPSLAIDGLPYADLRAVISALMFGRLDEAVVGRMIRESRGNPGLLLQALDGASPAQFAGGFGIPEWTATPAPAVLAALSFRIEQLPATSRRLLVLASADPTGDAVLLRRAAARLGLPPEAFEPLESADWIRLSPKVTFPAPALRTWIYRTAGIAEREQAHHALGLATDPRSALDRRAWHLAHAARSTCEQLAGELERAVPTAGQRGGLAAVAAFLELATWLTGDPVQRSSRALSAATAKRRAGDPDAAAHLLADAEAGPPDPRLRWQIERERALVVFATCRGQAAAERLAQAAKRLESVDEAAAREAQLEALMAASFAGDSAALRPAIEAASRELETPDTTWLLACAAWDIGDDAAWDALSAKAAQCAREESDLAVLPYALTQRSLVAIHRGELTDAQLLAQHADRLFAATGSVPLPLAALLRAGWLGDESELRGLADAARSDASRRGEGVVLTAASLAEAILYNGLGRYDLALDAASDAVRRNDLGFVLPSLAELIEAAVRSGNVKEAAQARDELSARAQAAGTQWVLGIAARAQAILAEDTLAESLYQEAIERLSRSLGKADVARTQLLYGEWLRRQGRRIDARVQLRAAHQCFREIGAAAFTERAQREHSATGEKARTRSVDTLAQLTPQETRVAALARDGLTNPEIGAQLFISPRTVEYHLQKVFDKLGITSRQKLHLVLEAARP